MAEIKNLKHPEDSSQELPLDQTTTAHLIQLGYSPQQAALIERSAILSTGSSRKIDEELLRQVEDARNKLLRQGVSVDLKTTVTFFNPEKPPRIFYTAHWQLPKDMYAPKGQRGEPNWQIKKITSSILITKNIK